MNGRKIDPTSCGGCPGGTWGSGRSRHACSTRTPAVNRLLTRRLTTILQPRRLSVADTEQRFGQRRLRERLGAPSAS